MASCRTIVPVSITRSPGLCRRAFAECGMRTVPGINGAFGIRVFSATFLCMLVISFLAFRLEKSSFHTYPAPTDPTTGTWLALLVAFSGTSH